MYPILYLTPPGSSRCIWRWQINDRIHELHLLEVSDTRLRYISVSCKNDCTLTFAVIEHSEGVSVLVSVKLANNHIWVLEDEPQVPAQDDTHMVSDVHKGLGNTHDIHSPNILSLLQPRSARSCPITFKYPGRSVAKYYHLQIIEWPQRTKIAAILTVWCLSLALSRMFSSQCHWLPGSWW